MAPQSIVSRFARWLRLVGWFLVGISALRLFAEGYLGFMTVVSHSIASTMVVADFRRLAGGALCLLMARALRTTDEWGRTVCIYATIAGALSYACTLIIESRPHWANLYLTGLGDLVSVIIICRWLMRPDVIADFRQSDSRIPSSMMAYL